MAPFLYVSMVQRVDARTWRQANWPRLYRFKLIAWRLTWGS